MAIYAYTLDGSEERLASVETQRRICEGYAIKLGLRIDESYVDGSQSSKTALSQRPAGRELMSDLKRGDHLIVARLDLLWRSFGDFTLIVDKLFQKGVILHLVDQPEGVLDPETPVGQMLVHIMLTFAKSESRSKSRRISEGMQVKRMRGERFNDRAPLGWEYEKIRHADATEKDFYVMVPDQRERALMRQALEMRRDGYTLDQIRQYFNYEWKVRTRTGHEWSVEGISQLAKAADRMAADLQEVAQGLVTADGAAYRT